MENGINTAHGAVPRRGLSLAAIVQPTPPDDIELKADSIPDKRGEVTQDV